MAENTFPKQDWEVAKTAARQALEDTEVGKAVVWKNPDSGNSGEMKTNKACHHTADEQRAAESVSMMKDKIREHSESLSAY